MDGAPRAAIVSLGAVAVLVLVVLTTQDGGYDGGEVAVTPANGAAAPGQRQTELAEAARFDGPEGGEANAQEQRPLEQAESSARESDDPTPTAGKVQLDVLVVDHGTNIAIPGAHVWLAGHDNHKDATTDGSGRATFLVAASHCAIGAYHRDYLPSHGEHNRVEAGDPATWIDSSGAAGPRIEFTLPLHRGATVRGRILEVNGLPPRPHSFRWLRLWGEDRWSAVAFDDDVVTDSEGAFEFRGLEPGTYLIAPPPDAIGTFGLHPIEVTYGDVLQTDVWVAESRSVSFELDVVQTETHDPWPFPLNASVRYEPMGLESQIDWSISGQRLPHEHPPLVQSLDLTPGTYTVSLFSRTGQRNGEAWISALWGQSATVEVDDTFHTEHQKIEVPDVGPLARIDGSISRSFSSTPRTLRITYANLAGTLKTIDMPIDPDNLSFTLWIDLDQISQQQVSFSVPDHRNGMELASIPVVEGRQQITIGPSGR